MTALQLSFLQSAVSAVFAVVTTIAFENYFFNPTSSVLVTMLYLTIFATVLTTFVQTKFQKDTTPTRAAIIFTIEPVWACIYAYFILGETMGPLGIVGGGLIVAGVLLSELSDMIPFLNKAVRP